MNRFRWSRKQDWKSEAPLQDLMTQSPMKSEQYLDMKRKRTERRREIEAAMERRAEDIKYSLAG